MASQHSPEFGLDRDPHGVHGAERRAITLRRCEDTPVQLDRTVHDWFPKITGRMYSERLGKIHFWWMFVTFTALFSVMHTAGIAGMNRRVADYPVALEGINVYLSIMAFLLGASFLLFLYNMINSAIRGPAAGDNPWQTRTLEWQVSSPPPEHNFPREPEVVGSPYGYGTDDKVHALVGAGHGAGSEADS